MSLSVSQDAGTMVITISTNPKSKWPILCQILGTLCYSPVCSVSQNWKTNIMNNMNNNSTTFGIVQIIVGVLSLVTGIKVLRFWLGSVFLMVGIVTVVAVRFPSDLLLLAAVVLNKISATLALTGLGVYAWDITDNYANHNVMTRTVLDITMIIFLILQFCATLSFSVLTLKEICGMKTVKNLEFYKPLKEELTVSHLY